MREALLEAARKAGAPDVPASSEEAERLAAEEEAAKAAEQESGDKGETEEVQTPNQSESTDDNEDLEQFPEDWFGYNIREYAEENGVEAAKTYFSALQDADRAVNARLRENAKARKEAEENARKAELERRVAIPEPEEDTEPTDEELLEAAGIDPSLLQYEDLGKPVAQLVKMVLTQKSELDNIKQETQASAWETSFFGDLAKLEAQHGKLPEDFDRGTLLQEAYDRNIGDPNALYWSIVGPMKVAKVDVKPTKKPTSEKERITKKAISSKGRRGAAPGSVTPGKTKGMRAAFEKAKADLNITDEDPFAA